MSDKPDPSPEPAEKANHTEGGAPTDEAHEEAGDGTLSGSVPAGLSSRELRDLAKGGKTDDGGTG
ncbi:hypothetical protein EAH89_06975 [Roseomonas nepalensis]|uniref:Uncharacterized protein n=1 Tax=Muricoccus nepalensis TaxID=1854500 RepID=A0A502GCM6_9PROT|nr:hypothetical protein [Roseomonas nepalensis]TPG59090.1 hypothetical protein EAH89_06975 [Roseomonas nepalensis]